MDEQMSYRAAGVDLDSADLAVEKIKQIARTTFRPEVIQDIGGFGGLFNLDTGRYRRPVLVAGTDGVGTKLKIALALGKHDTVGQDCVAMCVNDLLAQGAEPLFFLDYLAVGRLDPDQVAQIVSGVAEGCRQAGCALLGGETAEMPGFYPPGEYDLAGFAVGVVERDRIIDGSSIREGDMLVGLASNGVHSNGYSLVRKILEQTGDSLFDSITVGDHRFVLGEELLKPTWIYVKPVLSLLQDFTVKGIANITGGGLPGNVPRVIPQGLRVNLYTRQWAVPSIFSYLQDRGRVEEKEMYRVFNMGVGMVLAVLPHEAAAVVNRLKEKSQDCSIIGEVVKGEAGPDRVQFVDGKLS